MSLRSLRNAAVFRSAQATYDAMCPEDDGISECAECGGSGRNATDGETCVFCAGFGEVDEDGFPFDRRQAARDRNEYLADMRDDR